MSRRSQLRSICCVVVLAVCATPSCGGSPGLPGVTTGTVSLWNQTNLGMAPKTITSFVIQPQGGTPSGELLVQPLLPGGIVILGPFPAGRYDATAVLDGMANANFQEDVVSGLPTTFIVPP